MEQVRGFMFVEISGRAVAPPPRALSVHRSRSSQTETQFHRYLDNCFPEPVVEISLDILQISHSPARKPSNDWAFSLPQEQPFFEESQRPLSYDEDNDDKSTNTCPVGCGNDVHHGKPCESKTPPKMPAPEVPPPPPPTPIKRRRTSMAPEDAKFEGKRLRFDVGIAPYQPSAPLNAAFFYDSE